MSEKDLQPSLHDLQQQIKQLAQAAGFQAVGISNVELSEHEAYLQRWLADGFHGEMSYMARHGHKRSRPQELEPGTLSVISVRMDYWPSGASEAMDMLENPDIAYVSRYALGRDYHKLMRKRLQALATELQTHIGEFGYRVFVDSAPVLEKALAEKAGLGWIGKHSNLLHQSAGSWFFLGEIYTDLPLNNEAAVELGEITKNPDPDLDHPDIEHPLPAEKNIKKHCGSCRACMDACPTQAIVAPYRVDARRCISYLTIELRGSIPLEFRKPMGNRIYGCDDCQLVCPFNKFSTATSEADFEPRHALDNSKLVDLFQWSEADFDSKTQGSAIRRIGYECWLRNIAVALGNAPTSAEVIAALESRRDDASELVCEHTQWALQQHEGKTQTP